MKLLLDTHIWTWSVAESKKIGRTTARAIERSKDDLWLSSVSVWEFIRLSQKGQFSRIRDPFPWVEQALSRSPVRQAPLTHEIALEAGRFHMSHKDPFDYLIVATARVLNLVLVTADQEIIAANVVKTLEND